MSDLKAKMHQNRFWLGVCPRPSWGSLQRSPDPVDGLKAPLIKGEEGREVEWRGKEGREGKEGDAREGKSRGKERRGPRFALVWGPRMVNPAL